eukprot:comp24268_c0_seq1/m.45249 comp24268_c0_seq1/g.45249  ORF comp24268_c0_seq1/g.45249 comp24268_c0_seq1/m.45249 type:complete len:1003 (-) comp24268_c0_seq1:459-3467(-)
MAPRKLVLGLAIVAAALAVSVAGEDSFHGHTKVETGALYKHVRDVDAADGKAIEITAQNDSTENAPAPSSNANVDGANNEQAVDGENSGTGEPSNPPDAPAGQTTQATVGSVVQNQHDDLLYGISRMAVRGNGFDADGYDSRGYSAFGFDAKGVDEKGRNVLDPDSGSSGKWLVTATGKANIPTKNAADDPTQEAEPTPPAEETKPQEENANEDPAPSVDQPNTDTRTPADTRTSPPEPNPNTDSPAVDPSSEIQLPATDEPVPSPPSDTPPAPAPSTTPVDSPVPNPVPATNPDLYGSSYMATRGQGFDADGYDQQGYDAMGFNQKGVDRQGRSKLDSKAGGKSGGSVAAGGEALTPTETSTPTETADREQPSKSANETPDSKEPKQPTNLESKQPPATVETTSEPAEPVTTESGQQPGPVTTDQGSVPAVSPVDTSAPVWDDLYSVAMMGVRGQGFDADGYNMDGFDVMGFTRKGYDKWGRHKTVPEAGLVPPGGKASTPTDGKANIPKHNTPPPPLPPRKTSSAKPGPTHKDIAQRPTPSKKVNPTTVTPLPPPLPSSSVTPTPEPTVVYPCGRAEHCGKYDTVCVDYTPVCRQGKCKKGYYNSGVLPYSPCIGQSEVIVGGRSVAINGDGTVMVEGLPEAIEDKRMQKGQAAVFRKTNGQWKQVQSLMPADQPSADWFGVSVDICGDGSTIVVGSWLDSVDKRYAGSAYIFKYEPSKREYRQHLKLVAPDGKGFDYFGQEVKISFDCSTVVVGAYGRDDGPADNSGAAYVFKAHSGGWKYTYAQTLREDKPTQNTMLGQSLAVNGDGSKIFVGGQHSGMVLYWEQHRTKYVYKQTISSNLQAHGFGHSISTNWIGDALAVGVPGDNYVAIYRENSNGIYKIDDNGRVILPEGHRYGKAKFGFSVSLNSNYGVKDTAGDSSFLLVGAPDQVVSSVAGAGTAYVYQYQSWNGGWGYTDLSFHGGVSKPHFGHAVALDSSGNAAGITDGRGKISMYSWSLE